MNPKIVNTIEKNYGEGDTENLKDFPVKKIQNGFSDYPRFKENIIKTILRIMQLKKNQWRDN